MLLEGGYTLGRGVGGGGACSQKISIWVGLSLRKPEFRGPYDCPFQDTAGVRDAVDPIGWPPLLSPIGEELSQSRSRKTQADTCVETAYYSVPESQPLEGSWQLKVQTRLQRMK